MNFIRSIHVIDSHTMGEPTRIVIGGVPQIPGSTMPEKKDYLIQNMDHIRKSLMHEPRGHNDMFGSILTAACDPSADFGIIFMDGGGYLNMCGHGSIGAATAAVETGIVEKKEPVTMVRMEAPAGLIEAAVNVKDGRVESVSIKNVPAFLYKENVSLDFDEFGKIRFDIAFGGSFFAIVPATELKMKVDVANVQQLKEIGIRLRNRINQEIPVQHPLLPHIKTVDLVEIFDKPSHQKADYKNVVVFGDGQVDRSPCGTGTSAKMATLFHKGKLKKNQDFFYESISGTIFRGQVLDVCKVADLDAVIPEITGSAYITGFNNIVIDEHDPFKYGFTL